MSIQTVFRNIKSRPIPAGQFESQAAKTNAKRRMSLKMGTIMKYNKKIGDNFQTLWKWVKLIFREVDNI